jgi:hypothetical protein
MRKQTKRTKQLTEASPPPSKFRERLTLDSAAKLTLRELPALKSDRSVRAAIDLVRKRIERDARKGLLPRNSDGTFSLANLATWLRRTRWRGIPERPALPNLPGMPLAPIEQHIIRKRRLTFEQAQAKADADKEARRRGQSIKNTRPPLQDFLDAKIDVSVRYEPHLFRTLAECHDEIRRLAAQLTDCHRGWSALVDENEALKKKLDTRKKQREAANRRKQ